MEAQRNAPLSQLVKSILISVLTSDSKILLIELTPDVILKLALIQNMALKCQASLISVAL